MQVECSIAYFGIAEQQNPQQHFRINRGSPRVAVGVAQLFVDQVETHVAINDAQQMVFGT